LPFILVADAGVSSAEKARPAMASDTIMATVFMMDLLNQPTTPPKIRGCVAAASNPEELLPIVVLRTVAFRNIHYKGRLSGEGTVQSGEGRTAT
jgi:hypothetical protein